MTDEKIEMQVKEILADKFGVTLADKFGVTINTLDNSTSFTYDLGIDSLDMMEALMEIERQFTITISNEDAEKLETVNALLIYISQQLKSPKI